MNGKFFYQIFKPKKTMKILSFLVLGILTTFFSSCFLVEKENGVLDDLTPALNLENLGVLKFEDNTYVFNKNSARSISKFIDKKKVREFNYVESSLNLKEDSFENLRVIDDSFKIINRVTGEFIQVFNLSQNEGGFLNFDIRTSNGKTLEGFNYLVPNVKSPTS